MSNFSLKSVYPLYLANEARQPNSDLVVTDKYTGQPATRVALADAATIDAGIAAATAAAEPMARMAAYERQEVLYHCVARFRERAEELAYALCVEAGKPIRDARGEVTRLIDTFRIAAEEAVRITGEIQPLDISPRARGYQGMWKRVPIGPCSFISPFNFPFNLAAHKIAPALAVGCPFVHEARLAHAAGRAHHRRGAGRNEPAEGRVLHPARAPRRRGPLHHRRAPETAVASPVRRKWAGR